MISQLKPLLHRLFFVYGWDYDVLVLVLLSASVICFLLKKSVSSKKFTGFLFPVSFVIYLILVIYLTIVRRISSENLYGLCLIPFYSYYQYSLGIKEMIRLVIMNIALFYPFGFLLSCIDVEFLKKKKWMIIIFALLFSTCIEIVQYTFRLGYAETDDVIHNTLGAGIGMLAYTLMELLTKAINKMLCKKRL